MSTFAEAMQEEQKWGKTENGADALTTTGTALVDFLARAGAMREADADEKQRLFDAAWKENPEYALKLLFYTRDFRDQHGYGERQMFKDCLSHLAIKHPQVVEDNLWAVMEFGCAKDLYCLVGTPAEQGMWDFMKNQFALDQKNMAEGKSISLLAKWVATPDASSKTTAALGKETAKHLGYDFKHMRDYKKILRSMREYLDVPERKMCAGKWNEIEYAKCTSKFLLKNRNVFEKHDGERWNNYIASVTKGEAKINTGALTPVDVVHQALISATEDRADLQTMWDNLPNLVKEGDNVLVIADTSGSMFGGMNSVRPIEVSLAMALYFSERMEGPFKDTFMTFSEHPEMFKMQADTLAGKLEEAQRSDWGNNTDIEAAYMKILEVAQKHHVPQSEMPKALMIVSDMQFDNATDGFDYSRVDQNNDTKIPYYDRIKAEFIKAGYDVPKVIFWNVNAKSPTFHADARENGVQLVSGYSPNVFRQVMDCIDKTPYQMMLEIVQDPRYKDITTQPDRERDRVRVQEPEKKKSVGVSTRNADLDLDAVKEMLKAVDERAEQQRRTKIQKEPSRGDDDFER